MGKRLILILVLAFVVGITSAAYAEVQNVKVSGDLTITGVARDNLDLAKDTVAAVPLVNTSTYSDEENDIFTIARLRVDADLTDNVTTTVRLLNERIWNGESTTGTEANRNIGLTAAGTAGDENDIDVDLAFVTLKEFLYSPLTLAVGRQELRFGNGWIVGDPDTNGVALGSELAAGDLSARKSFDAIRATLNYDPLVVDLVYAKVEENNTTLNDDITLAGVNANYELNKNTTLEGFFFSKIKGANAAAVTNVDAGNTTSFGDMNKSDKVHTVGVRAVNKSVKNLTLDVQGAYQFGTYNPKFDPNARWVSATDRTETAPRRAWGTEIVASYDLKDIAAISKYSPSLTGAYIYLSGEDRDRVQRESSNKSYSGWSGMFEDQTFGHLFNAIMGFSNIHLGGLNLKAKPIEDLSLSLDYVRAYFAKRYPEGRNVILSGVSTARQFRMGKTSYVGQEVDLSLTYDYTEDVQFSLLGGIFMPGKAINEGGAGQNRVDATEIIGSMRVTF